MLADAGIPLGNQSVLLAGINDCVFTMKKLVNETGEWTVKGAEMLDYKSLSSVNDPVFLKYKGKVASSALPGVEPGDETGLTAVLTETKARTPEEPATEHICH